MYKVSQKSPITRIFLLINCDLILESQAKYHKLRASRNRLSGIQVSDHHEAHKRGNDGIRPRIEKSQRSRGGETMRGKLRYQKID